MTQLYAQPYDTSATGFYFESDEEFTTRSNKLTNRYGDPVEEFEIQFIDGELIDCQFAEAIGLNQGNITHYFNCVDDFDDDQKIRTIIAVGDCSYDFDPNGVDQWDITYYEANSFRELAEQFVDEGLFGDIPDYLVHYIDYDAIGRDLQVDYSDIEIDGVNYIYCCR